MEAFYEELKPHMKWLSELAYKGLTSMDSKGLPRLVFDQGCFEDLNDETSKYRSYNIDSMGPFPIIPILRELLFLNSHDL